MQSARQASVTTSAMLSIVPSIRPWLTALRTASASASVWTNSSSAERCSLGEGVDRRSQLLVGRVRERAVDEAQCLEAVLDLIHPLDVTGRVRDFGPDRAVGWQAPRRTVTL